MLALNQVKAFVLDMDGTIYLEDLLLPGAVEFVHYLQEAQIPYLFLTNNSSKARRQYHRKLSRLGVAVQEEQIFTSGEATAIYLKEKYARAGIYLVGTPALREEFRQHGYRLTVRHPAAVVLGFDTTLTYKKLWRLCDLVRAGLPYFATHPDLNCPVEGGYMPDIGAMIAFVAAATGRQPDEIIGKPNYAVVEALKTRLQLPAAQICMVGDRLYTDIALGRAGMRTALVFSGETKQEDLPASPFQPDIVAADLADLLAQLRAARH